MTSYEDIGKNAENGTVNQSFEHDYSLDHRNGIKENTLSISTSQNSVPPSLTTEIEHENELKHRDGIGTEYNIDHNSVPNRENEKQLPNKDIQQSSNITRPNSGNIYKLYNDTWGCENCDLTGDFWFMEKHTCNRTRLKK